MPARLVPMDAPDDEDPRARPGNVNNLDRTRLHRVTDDERGR